MGLDHILIVDLDPNSCRAENCRRIPELIRGFLTVREIHLQTVTVFPPEPIASPPALILFRPSLTKPLPEALLSLRKKWNQISILGLFCTRRNTPTDVFQSFLNGLDDFLSCPIREIDLFLRIQRLLHCKNRVVAPSQAQAFKEKFHLESLVGECDCFLQVIEKIPPMAHSDATVVISGETGTGKELFARAIHYLSLRKDKPFIPVNCGALPDHLFENELFGHIKGAFTDASCAEKGLIAEAEGGTLLLDEIDTLSPSAQIKLLRFLQDGEYRPLGSSKNMVADVRIIAATNTDLRQRAATRLFREDLYHRLNVLSLSIPPLRERTEDIPLLAAHFLLKCANQCGRGILHLSPGALQNLLSYHWPGNVRELEGVIQRAVILASSPTLQPSDLDLPLPCQTEASAGGCLREAKTRAIKQFERAYLTNLLVAHQGNITRAAKAAGKDRRTFQKLLLKYGLKRPAFRDLS